MRMTIEGVRGKETDKEPGQKLLPQIRPESTDTIHLMYPWKQRGEPQILTGPFQQTRSGTRAHERNIQKLKVDWIAPLSTVSGMDTCRLCRWTWIPGTQWAQWNASLSSNFSLLCFTFFIYVSFVSSYPSLAPPLLAHQDPATPVSPCRDFVDAYPYTHVQGAI